MAIDVTVPGNPNPQSITRDALVSYMLADGWVERDPGQHPWFYHEGYYMFVLDVPMSADAAHIASVIGRIAEVSGRNPADVLDAIASLDPQ